MSTHKPVMRITLIYFSFALHFVIIIFKFYGAACPRSPRWVPPLSSVARFLQSWIVLGAENRAQENR